MEAIESVVAGTVEFQRVSVVEATNVSLAAAGLTASEGPDAGAVAVLLRLAETIDQMDAVGEVAAQATGRPKAFDNVTIPTYLKYAEALGLTVAARARAAADRGAQGGGQGGGGNLAAVLTLAGQATGKAAG